MATEPYEDCDLLNEETTKEDTEQRTKEEEETKTPQLIEELKILRRDVTRIPALSSFSEMVNNYILSLLDPTLVTDSTLSVFSSSKLKRKNLKKFCCNHGVAKKDQHFSQKWYLVPTELKVFIKLELEKHKRHQMEELNRKIAELEKLRPLLEEMSRQRTPNIWVRNDILFYPGIPKLSPSCPDGYAVTASSQHDADHAPHFAFDGNPMTHWATAANAGESWLQLQLPRGTAFNAVQITARGDVAFEQAPTVFRIEASLDAKVWETLDTESTTWTALGQVKRFVFDNVKPFLYYRLSAVKSLNPHIALGDFSLGYGVKVFKRMPVVPSIHSDSVIIPGGQYKLSSDPSRACNNVRNLFDGKADTFFTIPGATSGHVQAELPRAKFVNVFSIGARNDSSCVAAPRDYVLLGSQTGTDWISLFTISGSNPFGPGEIRTHFLRQPGAYKFYKLEVANPAAEILSFALWDLSFKNEIYEDEDEECADDQ